MLHQATRLSVLYRKETATYSSFNLLATRCTMAPNNEVRLSVFEARDRSSPHNKTVPYFTIIIFHLQNVQKFVRSSQDFLELDKALCASLTDRNFPRLPPLDEKRRLLSRHIFSRKTVSERLESYLSKILNDVALANQEAVKKFLALTSSEIELSSTAVSLSRRGSSSTPYSLPRRPSNYNIAPPRTTQLRGFQILKVLGQGSMGKVFLVKDTNSGQLRAMKTVKKESALQPNQPHNTRTERNILASLSKLNSPFLIHLYTSFQTSSSLFFVFDYCSGGDLATHITKSTRFSEARAKFYLCQIILGLQSLHDQGILYRDLKPENILLNQAGNVVLTDFGLSKQIGLGRTNTFCGTAFYLAPEILLGEEYGYSVDWWSVGVVFYEMMVGQTPFKESTNPAIYERIIAGDFECPKEFISSTAANLIGALLLRDPRHRLGGAAGASELLQYPFFEDTDWEAHSQLKLSPPYVPDTPSEPLQPNFQFFDETCLSMDPSVSPCPSIASSSCSFASFQPVLLT